MVKEKDQNNHILYQCEECGLWYRDKKTAEQCQAWCREHHTCNIKIIKQAVENNRKQ